MNKFFSIKDHIVHFIANNTVMMAALVAAVVTSFIIPPDEAYLDYFDFKTLTCLFCVLAVVCALKNVRFFYILARQIVKCFKDIRYSILGLVYITFIGSMLIANDMALLTFLPLGFLMLSTTGEKRYMAFTFVMQNIAANLGGMLTPFGNPQNLYLYSKFNIPTLEFMGIMAPLFILSVVLITICCFLFVKPHPLKLGNEPVYLPKGKTAALLVLFLFAIVIVFKGVPYWVGLIVIPVGVFLLDRKALRMVDYPLLLTFVFFFIFSGNMARIPLVRDFFSGLMEKSTLLFSIMSCQIISNVPSAILLSQFTENYRELLLGVNIGGVGTLISSLASLITYREYVNQNPDKAKSYMLIFTGFNVAFLIILTLAALLLGVL